jgi:hypothetical protein
MNHEKTEDTLSPNALLVLCLCDVNGNLAGAGQSDWHLLQDHCPESLKRKKQISQCPAIWRRRPALMLAAEYPEMLKQSPSRARTKQTGTSAARQYPAARWPHRLSRIWLPPVVFTKPARGGKRPRDGDVHYSPPGPKRPVRPPSAVPGSDRTNQQ